jgi:hypothetical protein
MLTEQMSFKMCDVHLSVSSAREKKALTIKQRYLVLVACDVVNLLNVNFSLRLTTCIVFCLFLSCD